MKVFVVATLVVLLLLILLTLVGGSPGFQAAVALVFGWLSFLWRVIPQMTVYWPSVAVGLAALVLLVAGVHWGARTWRRNRGAEQGQRSPPRQRG